MKVAATVFWQENCLLRQPLFCFIVEENAVKKILELLNLLNSQ
jgi:hypothetical protein